MTLCLDPSASRLSTEHGDGLYGEDGAPSATLEAAFAFALELEAAFPRARAFCDRLAGLGLLVPSTARLPSGRSGPAPSDVTGFAAVDRGALARLPAAERASLQDAGHLEAVYAHLLSLDTMRGLAWPTDQAS